MKKDYKVGYGKPPKQSQFKPGRSGNPKGRPKQKRSLTAKIEHELKKCVAITENGRSTKVSKGDALVKTLVARALKGDIRSVQIVINNSDSLRGHDALQPADLDALDLMILEQYAQDRKGDGHAAK